MAKTAQKKSAPTVEVETAVEATAPAKAKKPRPAVRDIDDAKVKELGKTLYEIGGGSKTAVFRALFSEGYTIGEVYKACQKSLWPKLIRPHVQNEHARWVNDTKQG